MKDYLEEINKRQVKDARVATSILKDEMYPSINAAYQAVRQVLLEYGDITSIRDVNRLNEAINKAISDNLNEGFAAASASMATLATSDASFTAGLLSSAAGVSLKAPTETQADRFIRQSIMSLSSGNKKQSAIWPKFIKGYEGTMANRYNSIITAAYNDSLTTGKMQTVGQLTKQFRDLNNNLQRHEAETLIRTATQHYSSRANQLMADSNSDIIEREVPIVTFDSRISDVCISISARYSKGWLQGKSPIGYPPYHYGCRTVIGYLLYGQAEFEGTKASKGAKGGKQIAATTPFAKFLRDQPKSFVYETLGKRKGELFLAGELPLANLTDKYLNPLPLSVLDG